MATSRTNTAKWMPSHNRWQIKVQKDGERKSFYSSKPGREGQREANAKADAWLGGNIISPNIKAKGLYAEWLAELKATTSKSHWRQYDSLWRTWMDPWIGTIKVSELTEQHLQNAITRAHKKGLSYKTLSNIRACATAFIKFARKNRATTLVVENVTIPKDAPKNEKIILQPDDISKLFENGDTLIRGKSAYEVLVNGWRFGVVTGLRPGEVNGLMWSDIDKKIVHVQRSINVYGETTAGKNENAKRDFAMTELAQSIIKDQRKKMFALGIRSKYVFPAADGNPVLQTSALKRWNRYRDYHGISKSTLYGLRHTFVSMAKALPEGVVKSLVGHSHNMDTFGVYGHEVDGELLENAQMLQDRFKKILGL